MDESQSQTNVGYAVLDENGRVSAANSVFQEWLGNRNLATLLPQLDLIKHEGSWASRTHICLADSISAYADVELTRLHGDATTSIVVRIQIVSDSQSDDAYRDVVTGLPDRRALSAHRSRWERDANGKLQHALLFLDLDNFKQINDALGHAIGDRVLGVLADRWRKSLRGRDLIVRYGGDEFVALLAGVRSLVDAQPIVNRLQRVTMAPIQVDSHTLEVSVAIGVALAEHTAQPLEELLIAADRAMYAAKRQNS